MNFSQFDELKQSIDKAFSEVGTDIAIGEAFSQLDREMQEILVHRGDEYQAIFRPAAQRDFSDLYSTLAKNLDDAYKAVSYMRRLQVLCSWIENLPERGQRRDDLYPGLRILNFENRITLVFLVERGLIRIGRILFKTADRAALSQHRVVLPTQTM